MALLEDRFGLLRDDEVHVARRRGREHHELRHVTHGSLALGLALRDAFAQRELARKRDLLLRAHLEEGELRLAEALLPVLVVVADAERGIRQRAFLDRSLAHREIARLRRADVGVARSCRLQSAAQIERIRQGFARIRGAGRGEPHQGNEDPLPTRFPARSAHSDLGAHGPGSDYGRGQPRVTCGAASPAVRLSRASASRGSGPLAWTCGCGDKPPAPWSL